MTATWFVTSFMVGGIVAGTFLSNKFKKNNDVDLPKMDQKESVLIPTNAIPVLEMKNVFKCSPENAPVGLVHFQKKRWLQEQIPVSLNGTYELVSLYYSFTYSSTFADTDLNFDDICQANKLTHNAYVVLSESQNQVYLTLKENCPKWMFILEQPDRYELLLFLSDKIRLCHNVSRIIIAYAHGVTIPVLDE